MATKSVSLSAIGDDGKAVDWWVLYKVAGHGKASDGSKPKGTEYVFCDSEMEIGEKSSLSAHTIDDPKNGAVSNTMNQIYNNLNSPDIGWYFYNDEPSNAVTQTSAKGHTKGVVCFNMANNTGFWMVFSSPKFPIVGKYVYPTTAMEMAQSFLCISLDADTIKTIAGQMATTQHPNVYAASKVPAAIKDKTDPRSILMNMQLSTPVAPFTQVVPFKSRGGQYFRCIAKNMKWDAESDDDFYNDLVGPILAENIDVETWEHDPTPDSQDSDKTHTVLKMNSVDLAPLGINPSYSWSEENDHAKIAISADKETPTYICIGDINFTKAQEKRSGGTVAFICDPLWKAVVEILSTVKMITSAKPSSNKKKTIKVANNPLKGKVPVKKKPVKKAPVKKTPAKKKPAAKKKAAPAKKVVKKTAKKPVKKKVAVKRRAAPAKKAVKKTVKKTVNKKAAAKKK